MSDINLDQNQEIDYEKKIEALKEEIKRKDEQIENLKEENKILFETAMKNSERKVDAKLKKKVEEKKQ